MLKINEVFDSKYRIESVIGSGGMGTVYLARNIKLGTLWAIKEVDKSRGDKVDLLAEPNILKKLNHPSLPRIFDILEDESHIYIIMDYIEGIPLDKELAAKRRFPEKQVIKWAKQICDVLKYLHAMKPNPIIYRDMKPSNLIITSSGDVKIIDFGIAREFKKESTADTTYIGTRGYAAPEQYGTSQTDARTDIYSLGVTLYHMLTGKSPNEPPYEIKPVRELDSRLSRGIEHIIARCTRQDPSHRYQSVEKLYQDLCNIKKFDAAYKRRMLKKDITVGAFILAFFMFGLLTYKGMEQLEKEKIDDYYSIVQEGAALIEQGHFQEAIETLGRAAEKIPEKPEAYKETALAYFRQNDYDGCIEYIRDNYTNIMHLAGDMYNTVIIGEIEYICGTAYYEKKDYANAALYFSQASEKVPTNLYFKRDLAVSLAKSGETGRAEAILDETVENGLNNDAIAYVKGEIAYTKGNYGEAAGYFSETISMTEDPDLKKRAYFSLADTYGAAGDSIENALELEIQTLERARNDLNEMNNIVLLEMLGNAYSQKAAELNGAENEAYIRLAIGCFEKITSLGYKRSYMMRNVAILYQQAGDLSRSEEMLIDMKNSFPDDYRGYMQMAFLYADMESRKDNALRDYAKVKENYDLALKYYAQTGSAADDPEMKALEGLINELKEKGWLE